MVKTVLGQYRNNVAPNGRVALPKKFRDQLGAKFILTQGYEQSLLMVPYENWENMIKTTVSKPFLIGEARDTVRFLLGGATPIDLDDQGRFIIPSYLRDYCGLASEAIFLGLGNYLEIWDSAHWATYQKKLNTHIEEIASKLSKTESE